MTGRRFSSIRVGLFIASVILLYLLALRSSQPSVLSRTIKAVFNEGHKSFNWDEAPIEDTRLPYVELNQLIDNWSNEKEAYSFLVAHEGKLVIERYFNRRSIESPNTIKSICKVWITTLTGIAIQKKLLSGVDETIANLIPDAYSDIPEDDPRREVTVSHLLSMRSGYQIPDEKMHSLFRSENWVRDAAHGKLSNRPGDEYFYSTSQTHLLSGSIMASVGEHLHSFAKRELCAPLGISIIQWDTDPSGVPFGGSELKLTSRDLARLGQLYLQDGVINGERILPEGWVEESYTNRRQIAPGKKFGFGYNWWVANTKAGPVRVALGNGGQGLAIYPKINLIVVVTRSHKLDSRNHNNKTLNMFGTVIPQILAQYSIEY